VVSDHGSKTVKKKISLRKVLDDAHFGPDVQALPEGGSGMIYFSAAQHSEMEERIAGALSTTAGIARVLRKDDFPALGYPLPQENVQMPGLIVLAQPGYAFAEETKGGGQAVASVNPPVGAHGYLNTDADMQAIFIASGYGIKKGVRLEPFANTKVAPTLAALLGVQLSTSEEPINEVLQ
jgi:predicted AlkP superfamily pyrophosphatase or phosphodiesterase